MAPSGSFAGRGDSAPDDLVLVGRIVRSHGLRGQVVVAAETDFVEERFAPGAALLVNRGGRLDTLTIDTVRFHPAKRGQGARPIVGFAGVGSIEQAEALGRVDLWIRAGTRAPLPEGEFYHDALIGCRVETAAGETIGVVRRIDGTRGIPLLVVVAERATDGAAAHEETSRDATRAADVEVLIPLAEAICPVIDPAAGRIVIDPPEGLLDLNR